MKSSYPKRFVITSTEPDLKKKIFSDVCEAHNRLIKRRDRISFSQLFLHLLRIEDWGFLTYAR